MKIMLFTAALLCLLAAESSAQNDSTRYINGLPVTEDDTARQVVQSDIEPKDKLRAVAPEALPADLLKTLEDEEQYAGWRDSTVYFDANTNLYIVHIKSGDAVKIIGLNENGKPVTFSELSVRRE
jgi:hypothetical protein